ncbi:hypothetical protein FEM48_Zijuj09G0205300 [Ziziphus jujuba var. spinosa]|uniref:FAD-dependent oxidoreductase domain-containing protein 1 n=1 Tax=Ziziphus jujuba var. spinosa TaxID=714518 RepID=A0A978UV60_ZIZJJ|nr:hypothetical protein FEM48_Zijuj09G0205300 [Ziziphus jujuba var. spinosa]
MALVDKAVPCSGATGAVQGYLWMVHKAPGTHSWGLAIRSHRLFVMLAESLREQRLDPLQHLGWKNKGSILTGRSPEELDVLKTSVTLLWDAGLRVEYLSRCWVNRHFSSEGRNVEFFYDPVTSLVSEEVIAIKTSMNTLYSKKAIVVAAGCYSGSLMHDLFRESEIVLDAPRKTSKGSPVSAREFDSIYHGLMEAGYVNLQTATPLPRILTSEAFDRGQALSISMTATMDSMGNLVLVPHGKPVIGPEPSLPNVFLATENEGGGLSMALGTAEMEADMLLGNSGKV